MTPLQGSGTVCTCGMGKRSADEHIYGCPQSIAGLAAESRRVAMPSNIPDHEAAGWPDGWPSEPERTPMPEPSTTQGLDAFTLARLVEEARAERDRYREVLIALVEASEEYFAPNSPGAPLWPRTVEARKLLDG